jgi:hypothetical protein
MNNMQKNKIVLEANTELRDNELREVVNKLWVRIESINERTKRQTIQIRELQMEVKRLNAKRKK